MSKPDWCQQRVWDEADQVSIRPDVAQIEAIARAIMAAEQREREACARIAEKEEYGNHIAQRVARIIAAAIRNRGTENE